MRRRLGAAGALLLVLSGCALADRGTSDPEWRHDAPSDRWYVADDLPDAYELIAEHLPQLDEVASATAAEGQYSDPHERAALPGPDDHWWQLAAQLTEPQIADLLTAAAPPGSDGGGAPQEVVTEEQIREMVVDPVEQAVPSCPSEWADVTPALAGE